MAVRYCWCVASAGNAGGAGVYVRRMRCGGEAAGWCVWGLLAGGAGSVELMTPPRVPKMPERRAFWYASHQGGAGRARLRAIAERARNHRSLTCVSVIVTANIASMVSMGEDESAAQPAPRNCSLVTHCHTVDLMMSVRRSRERTLLHKTIAVQHNSGIARWAQPNTNSDNMKTFVRQQN